MSGIITGNGEIPLLFTFLDECNDTSDDLD